MHAVYNISIFIQLHISENFNTAMPKVCQRQELEGAHHILGR